MSEVVYPIKVVVKRTGLSAHVIRVWERRYRAVEPKRTPTNRRAYSADDIERLRLLRQLTQQGHAIGFLAKLPMNELTNLGSAGTGTAAEMPLTDADGVIAQCLEATKRLDTARLESLLKEAELAFGVHGLVRRVIAPLAQRLGEQWRLGALGAAHEHFAAAVLRTVLGQIIRQSAGAGHAPVIVIATPQGQLHELGALIVGALAGNLGWRVLYLGASLPAAEIAAAARLHHARLVGLSLVYPEDDPLLGTELQRLRELLPADTGIITGGRASPAFADPLQRIGAVQVEGLDELGEQLDRLRRPAQARAE
ncbi:MAG TPA: MerR family transcriptional regulator [Lacunisphaera sp.]|nr:MerR family transcriptional regulator [Lacunisphaera sp.]